jgi:hypothetical protein
MEPAAWAGEDQGYMSALAAGVAAYDGHSAEGEGLLEGEVLCSEAVVVDLSLAAAGVAVAGCCSDL